MKSLLKKIIPQNLISQYHKTLAVLANVIYGRPSEKMIVVGATGTNGKSTTVSLIAKILEEAGYKVGATSTAIFKIAEKEWLNDKKMTMLGRFQLQKMLSDMVKAGCRYAVIETSSQGIDQFRHLGIHYDVCVFTNLTPEHIEAHGGFENYKKAKLKLFQHLEKQKNKIISPPFQGGVGGGLPELSKMSANPSVPSGRLPLERGGIIKKAIIVNGDDEHAKDFLNFQADDKYVYKIQDTRYKKSVANYELEIKNYKLLEAENIELRNNGESFDLNGTKFNLQLFGLFNIYNSLAAVAVAASQGIDLETCQSALEKVPGVPGRMEFINEGQNFKVLIDYAPEPDSLKQLYQTIKDHQLLNAGSKLIHVLGSCGGGRDVARRPVLGQLAAQTADFVIVTNEDPYDDDPQLIIDQVAEGATKYGKQLNRDLFKILDRREAIKFALNLAKKCDLVLMTGKGCEQCICLSNGRKMLWDERVVTRQELKNIK